MRTDEQMKARARGIAEMHFYCDEECTIPWEPCEYDEHEYIERECDSLASKLGDEVEVPEELLSCAHE